MNDLWTIVWKEWRDALFPGGKLLSFRPIIFIVLLGVIYPLIDSKGWLTFSSVMILATVFFPYIFILNYIGDAFAGERERHTLETLLASRISDRAILWGKVIANVSSIWGMTIFATLLSVVVVNLAQGQRPWTFYSPVSGWFGVLILTLLTCILSAGGGILVSMHSPTIRQAQQTLLLGSVGLFILIYLAARSIPQSFFVGMSTTDLFLIVVLVLAIIDAILLAIAGISYHRSRLILN
jgi:ABC-2 type transport system permease protein